MFYDNRTIIKKKYITKATQNNSSKYNNRMTEMIINK